MSPLEEAKAAHPAKGVKGPLGVIVIDESGPDGGWHIRAGIPYTTSGICNCIACETYKTVHADDVHDARSPW